MIRRKASCKKAKEKIREHNRNVWKIELEKEEQEIKKRKLYKKYKAKKTKKIK
jgi:hypothetical protein